MYTFRYYYDEVFKFYFYLPFFISHYSSLLYFIIHIHITYIYAIYVCCGGRKENCYARTIKVILFKKKKWNIIHNFIVPLFI